MRFSITRVPKRDLNREINWSSEVTTYQLSEKEIENVRKKMVHKSGLDRQMCIRRVASGESLSQIERAVGMRKNEIFHWTRKWNLVGINQKSAGEMLTGSEPSSFEFNVKEEPVKQKKNDAEKEKVGISKALAVAIETARTCINDKTILKIAAHGVFDPDKEDPLLKPIYDQENLLELAAALLNGYFVIDPIELELKIAYESAPSNLHQDGMERVLKILGKHYSWMKGWTL